MHVTGLFLKSANLILSEKLSHQTEKQNPDKNNVSRLWFPARMALGLIRFYQKWISPMLGANCRFRPTCSQYTFEAINKYGFFKGGLKGLYRILRCNPFSRGGDDPLD
jgi:putative membrane protein insertion efficiency factor